MWTRISCALVLACGTALAQPAKKGGRPKALDLAPLVTAISGVDEEAAAKAADELGESAEPAAHDALLDALAMGVRPSVAVEALAALAHHPAPPDVGALKRYAGHHNPSVRGMALTSLALYPDPVAKAAVVRGLHDPIVAVRNAAAQAAGKGKIKDAVESLFALLALGEEPAARALAAMADADLVRKIGDQFGKVPDAALAKCLGLVLKRADFGPDSERIDVVRAIAKIQDKAAVDALQDYLDATPKNPPRESRTEAQKVVEARGGK